MKYVVCHPNTISRHMFSFSASEVVEILKAHIERGGQKVPRGDTALWAVEHPPEDDGHFHVTMPVQHVTLAVDAG